MSVDLDASRRRGRRRRQERRAKQRAGLAVGLSFVMLLVLVGGVYLLGRQLLGGGGKDTADDYTGDGGVAVVVVVQRGDTASEIGRTLQQAGVVKTVKAFVGVARNEPKAAGIQPGSYELRKEMAAARALNLLLSPGSRLVSTVTVREGLRLDETVKLLAARTGLPVSDYQKALRNPQAIGLPAYAKGNAEGFLFPATYEVPPDATATAVLKLMTARFAEAAETTGIAKAGTYTPYQIVIIASIIEAEARAKPDFGKVGRVVHNRLAGKGDTGGKLEMDSTVNYLLKADKLLLTQEDLDVDSRYNTRKYPGLPPGPIGSPGEEALRAAASPPAGDWIFFVTVDKTGLTRFTADYDQFIAWKQEAKRNGVA